MLDWKINQRVFEAVGVKNDILGIHIPNDKIIYSKENLIETIKKQFNDLENIFIPAKSYCVALVYAHELVKDYGGIVTDYLSDNELLLNDIHFVPYINDNVTYDYFIKNTSWIESPMTVRIKEYYMKEIHLQGLNNDH
jgi:hypothetical protein